MIQSDPRPPTLTVRFFATSEGNEPVRAWLRAMPEAPRKRIGDEIRAMQFGWPVGMPLIRKLDVDLWEVRVKLRGGAARVLFTVVDNSALLLHGFLKKSRKTPTVDLELARTRRNQVLGTSR